MKRLKRLSLVTLLFCIMMFNTTLANGFEDANLLSRDGQSILLDSNIASSKDSIHQYGRGEYLAEGSVEIVNHGNGEIYICAYTYAYINADRILHNVFLEYWNEDREDWVQVGFWEFEQTREESENGILAGLTSTLTLTGYETGLYYRVRGLHGVEYNGELEACATRTDGVLITDN